MSYKLLITPAAQQDIDAALNHYQNIQVSLGERFITAVHNTYKRLEKTLHHYSFFGNQNQLRSVSLLKFPYMFVFQIEADTIYIFGLHTAPAGILTRY